MGCAVLLPREQRYRKVRIHFDRSTQPPIDIDYGEIDGTLVFSDLFIVHSLTKPELHMKVMADIRIECPTTIESCNNVSNPVSKMLLAKQNVSGVLLILPNVFFLLNREFSLD